MNLVEKCLLISLFSLCSLGAVSALDLYEADALTQGERKKYSRHRDSLALVNFYEQTNGTAWKVTWDLESSMDKWFGITLNASGLVACIDLDGDDNCSAHKKGGNGLTGVLPDLNLPNLEHLFLTGNQLTDTIPNFSHLENLLTLELACNQLSGTIPNFNHLERLNSLVLDYNQLTGVIPNFSHLPNLDNLYLSNNKLTGRVPDFAQLTSLKRLYLHRNNLTEQLPDFQTPELLELLMAHNEIEGKLPEFERLTKLRYLNLSVNKLSGQIPDWKHLRIIGEINLSSNRLEGTVPKFSMENLRTVLLENNRLTGVGKWESLPTLSTCSLRSNCFTFEDLLPIKQWLNEQKNYELQQPSAKDELIQVDLGENLVLKLDFDKKINSNTYEWYHDGERLSVSPETRKINFDSIQLEHLGTYYCVVKNPNFPTLTIQSKKFIIKEKEMLIPYTPPILADDRFEFTQSENGSYNFNVLVNDEVDAIEFWDLALLNDPAFGLIVEKGAGEFELEIFPEYTGRLTFDYEFCNLAREDLCSIGFVELMITKPQKDIQLEDISIPGGFSPNGDGQNDYFIINALDEQPEKFTTKSLTVVNQNGQIVYHDNNYHNDWAGTYMQTTRSLPMGIYFYKFTYGDDIINTKSGSISLLR